MTDIMYDCLNQKDTDILQPLQNSALRLILDALRDRHVDNMHTELQLITLSKRRKHHTCHQVYRTLNENTLEHLSNIIKIAVPRSEYKLRSVIELLLEVPDYKLMTTRKSFNFRVPTTWNILEEGIN